MSYEVGLTPAAERDLKRLPETAQHQIARQIRDLAIEPRPSGIVALKGDAPGTYRLRVGNYRIGYEVDDQLKTVRVWQIGDRKRFYERAKRRR